MQLTLGVRRGLWDCTGLTGDISGWSALTQVTVMCAHHRPLARLRLCLRACLCGWYLAMVTYLRVMANGLLACARNPPALRARTWLRDSAQISPRLPQREGPMHRQPCQRRAHRLVRSRQSQCTRLVSERPSVCDTDILVPHTASHINNISSHTYLSTPPLECPKQQLPLIKHSPIYYIYYVLRMCRFHVIENQKYCIDNRRHHNTLCCYTVGLTLPSLVGRLCRLSLRVRA
jgi:hypothetical protein